MDIQNQVKNIIIRQGGIAKSADFVAAGISAVQVVSLCNVGFLERVRHGYYSLAKHDTASEEQNFFQRELFVSTRHSFITDTAILLLVNGRLPFRALCHEQSSKTTFFPCRYIMFSRTFTSLAK